MTQERAFGSRLIECGYAPIGVAVVPPRLSDPSRGRYPGHGYVRGWGLGGGGLEEKVAAHPLYQEALAASRGRSLMSTHRLMNLFLIVAHYFDGLTNHDIVELGSYRGGSALFLGCLLKRLYPAANLYSFDTFSGMPAVDFIVDRHIPGDFANADLEGFLQARDELGLDRLHVVSGLVQDTFPASLPPGTRIGLAHFDMDIYEPTAYAQSEAWPLMTQGGYYVYDDATVPGCQGATQAVEELIQARRLHSEQIFPHFVFRVGLTP